MVGELSDDGERIIFSYDFRETQLFDKTRALSIAMSSAMEGDDAR